ncbi:MAG: nucleotidyltransferase domain-containing protein [Peptococcaceae bacterium]|nr:nucleotidyltransferase domain-containing protein [Peptococcaceae bacterium]
MVRTFGEAAMVVRDAIENKYPQVNRAFIFGSFAEGVQTTESDLDVLVELNDSMGLQFISMIQDIEEAAGTAVDVITIKQAHDIEEKFGYDILGKARPVYERAKS